MAIIKSYQKKTDTTYVYENTPYWDHEKQQARSKRKLIGKIDKDTGEIIPTGKRGRKKNPAKTTEAGEGTSSNGSASPEVIQKLERIIEEQKREILSLRTDIDSLKTENRKLQSRCEKAEKLAENSRMLGEFIKEFRSLADRARKEGLFDGL